MLEEEIVKKVIGKAVYVTTAESCTGGLLAGRILNVPGASSVYNEGHITYSNEAKERLLGVFPWDTRKVRSGQQADGRGDGTWSGEGGEGRDRT